MSGIDIEHQLAGHEMEEKKHPDPGDEARSGCWSSVKAILEKTMSVGSYMLWLLIAGGAGLVVLVAVVLGIPIIVPLSMMIFFSLPKKMCMRILGFEDKKLGEEGDELAGGIGGIYDRAHRPDTIQDRVELSVYGVIARAGLAALVWLGLSLTVPRLKEVTILGSPMWKWSLLVVTLTAGYVQIGTLTMLPQLLLKGNANYYYTELILSGHIPYISLVLGTWLAYFRTHDGLSHHHHWLDHKAFDYVTWTFVSLFLGSILMLCKKLLLVKWSAGAIYLRFEPRILITSIKFYFIGLLAAGFSEDKILDGLKVLDVLTDSDATNTKLMGNATVSKYVITRKTNLFHLNYVSRILIKLGGPTSPLQDREGDQEEVVTWFKQQINNDDASDTCTPDGLMKLFRSPEEKPELPVMAVKTKTKKESEDKLKRNKKLANVLWRLVGEEYSSAHPFTFDYLKIWMVDAHKDCINMGRTLADAKAIVTRLDIFMSFVICVIVLLLWLLITGVSSTTVLVTVATPFLALTFIFGDSAKIFFQGFIFCFATHPFDVGDRCIVDEVELEVKKVTILTTIFIKVGSKEDRLYPNSILATKAIVNLGWQPDPKDVIELLFDSFINLDALKIKIAEFFEEENKRYENTYNMVITEVGENIKVKIHFSHILTVHDLSHRQCYKKKSSQRSDFLYVIKKHLNESRMERMNTKDTSQSAASTTTREIMELNNKHK